MSILQVNFKEITDSTRLSSVGDLPSILGRVLQFFERWGLSEEQRCPKGAKVGTALGSSWVGISQKTQKIAYQQLQQCRPCPGWRPPLAASLCCPSGGFGSSLRSPQCHLSAKTKPNGPLDEHVKFDGSWRADFWGVNQRFTNATGRGQIFLILPDGSSDNETRRAMNRCEKKDQ